MSVLVADKLIANAYVTVGTERNTAALLGISKTAVHEAITRCPDDLVTAKKTLASKWAVAAEQVLEECVAGKHGEFKSKAEAWTAAAIAADKAAKLTEGPAVAIQVNAVVADMAELLNRLDREPGHIIEAPDVASDGSGQNS